MTTGVPNSQHASFWLRYLNHDRSEPRAAVVERAAAGEVPSCLSVRPSVAPGGTVRGAGAGRCGARVVPRADRTQTGASPAPPCVRRNWRFPRPRPRPARPDRGACPHPSPPGSGDRRTTGTDRETQSVGNGHGHRGVPETKGSERKSICGITYSTAINPLY